MVMCGLFIQDQSFPQEILIYPIISKDYELGRKLYVRWKARWVLGSCKLSIGKWGVGRGGMSGQTHLMGDPKPNAACRLIV